MIPVYNCLQFLPYTLSGVLSQDMGKEAMEIAVIDDCSTDGDVEALVQSIGKGRISYFRQTSNIGSLRNFQTCIERAKGHLIHILHGDDAVRHTFYSRLGKLFEQHPSLGAAYCRFAYIDEQNAFRFNHEAEMQQEGILQNWLARICERQRIQYSAIVVKRNVYEKLGSFYGVEYGEDWEMWARIAMHYDVGYIPDVLAEYRMHTSSISGKSFLTGKNMDDLEFVMKKIHAFLPEKDRSPIEKRSRMFYAYYALRVANSLWAKFRSRAGVKAQISAAWRMHRDFGLLYRIVKLHTRMLLNI
jgi:glycosyltransferase involved in cell wall biosynthesis